MPYWQLTTSWKLRVEERTQELGAINEELMVEISEHQQAEKIIRENAARAAILVEVSRQHVRVEPGRENPPGDRHRGGWRHTLAIIVLPGCLMRMVKIWFPKCFFTRIKMCASLGGSYWKARRA